MPIVRLVLDFEPEFVLSEFEILFQVASLYLSLTCAVMDSMLLISLATYITKPFWNLAILRLEFFV